MKRVVIIGMVLLLAGCNWINPTNPDPNHTHADFAVWIDGARFDFSGEEFMSEAETEGDNNHEEHGHKHDFLHLHDGNGYVIHRHKPGLTLGEFFDSLGISMTDASMTFEMDGERRSYGMEGDKRWRIFINGVLSRFDPAYVFEDTDQILLSWGTEDQLDEQWKQMTDEACRYSQTCPWRGKPPVENCIADPEVPCVAPLD